MPVNATLYSYHGTLKEIQFLRNNIMFTIENIGEGRISFPSSPRDTVSDL